MKLKLHQCKKCGKTYAEEMASREENICKTCMSRIDKDRDLRRPYKDKSGENLDKLSEYYDRKFM